MSIAELLKDCPQGMELNCTMWNNVVLDHVDMNSNYPIRIKKMGGEIRSLTKNGCYNFGLDAKCVIFPIGKDTWKGFHRPFKDGDFISFKNKFGNKFIGILKSIKNNYLHTYTYFSSTSMSLSIASFSIDDYIEELRLANGEEKENLFKELKHQDYCWNTETKTLEKLIKPKFNVGDTIQDSEGYIVRITEVNQEDSFYEYLSTYVNGIGTIDFAEQDEWKLIPNKFDISKLVPFESKVLVRDSESEVWKPAIFGGYIDERGEYKYLVVGGIFYEYLIPYENNEHLSCKRDNCNPYYQTWNK